jgi:hypothetical protein
MVPHLVTPRTLAANRVAAQVDAPSVVAADAEAGYGTLPQRQDVFA